MASVAILADSSSAEVRLQTSPFGTFAGSTNIASGDITGDRVPDLIAAAGPSGGPRVVVLDGVTGATVRSFYAFPPDFTGGVQVAAGDTNDDGIADIVAVPMAGGGPVVKVFDGATGNERLSFFAYPEGFTGGMSVAVGDLNGDGRADIVTGVGAGGGPVLKVFSGVDGRELLSTYALPPAFRGGVNVAAGDFDRDGRADALIGAGAGGSPHVRCFTLEGTQIAETVAGDPGDRRGVRVACLPGDSGPELLTSAPGSGTFTRRGANWATSSTFNSPLASTGSIADADTSNESLVLSWNDVALRTIRADRTPPPRAARALAILHAAVFDAVNAVTGTYQPYLPQPVAPAGASAEAAAVAAAHGALVGLFPTYRAKFDTIRAAQLTQVKAGRAEGVQVGEAAAAAMLANRASDLPAGSPYVAGTRPGEWRPTPSANAPFTLPNWGSLRPFTLDRGDQFRPAAPPALTSTEYAEALAEVEALGRDTSSTRTADQTAVAKFWAANAGSDTPPGMTNRIAAGLVRRNRLSLVEAARTFALVNLALADAGVVSWDAKRTYNWWRPVTAIREADTDGNPATTADPTWTPLLPTPSHPDYTSGHSTFTAAGATVLAGLFGETVPVWVWSPDAPNAARRFDGVRSAAAEAGRSRIYGGIHTQYANAAGLESGTQVGRWVTDRIAKPLAPG